MKQLFLLFIIFFNLSLLFGQSHERENLKKYNSYTVKTLNFYQRGWESIYFLKDGLIVGQENYCKKELRAKYEYKYDSLGNKIYWISTYDVNSGNKHDTVSHYQLSYDENLNLIKTESSSWITNYSNFNNQGKPLKIENIRKHKYWSPAPFKEVLQYDLLGNLMQETLYRYACSGNFDTLCTTLEIETNKYKYDAYRNVIELQRHFEPQREFPLIYIGGRSEYEIERFKYTYNKNGLWTKKTRIVNGRRTLLEKRIFK